MAITWTSFDIQPICVAEFRANVSFTVVNDDPVIGYTKTFIEKNATIETASQKAAILDRIWAQYQSHLAREAKIESWIDTAGQDGLDNLNGRL